MKPREELKDVVWQTVTSDVLSLKDKAERIVQHTDQLAIGKWVSVEERLPEFDELGVWDGYARLSDDMKTVEAGQWHGHLMARITTHWLDLELPSGKEEG